MRNLERISLLLAALALSACTATMVNMPGGSKQRSAYAPVNESNPTAGLIKYMAQGTTSAVKARRQDAYRQMHTACSGAYRIDGEGPKQENGLAVPGPESAIGPQNPYWFIQFSCVDKNAGGVAAVPEGPVAPTEPGRLSPDPR
jgi:hypothetical protein